MFQVQAGIIKYGRKAWIEINFDEFSMEKDLVAQINLIKHDNANESRLDLALEMAKEKLFPRSRGLRRDGAKVEKV